jgi:hypothetical protein
MNRLGLTPEEFHAALTALETAPSVEGVTLMTHFADADLEPRHRLADGPLRGDNARLRAARQPGQLGSAAALSEKRRGWARPGIMLYGSSPFPQPRDRRSARPAPGDDAGQPAHRRAGTRRRRAGRLRRQLFTADKPMRIGILSPAAMPTATRATRRSARRCWSKGAARARRPRLDGHDHGRPRRHCPMPASARRWCCGAKACRSTTSPPPPAPSATSCSAR